MLSPSTENLELKESRPGGAARWPTGLWNEKVWRERANFPLCLAPMVGLTHGALRAVVRSYTPKGVKTFWPTEMLNSRRLPGQVLGETPETKLCENDFDLVPQILGNNEEAIAQSISKLVPWGAIAIDINMGCPVQKALKHNYGVALMGDADYAAEVVRMTVKHSPVPVSVKLRAGMQNDAAFLENFVAKIHGAGASWITLHPRTAEQKRRGSADWAQIQRIKSKFQFPVIGNGDIQTADDVRAMLEETGCDMVMSGRALAARPWLMWQVGEHLGFEPPAGREGDRAPRTPEEEGAEYGRALTMFVDQCERFFDGDLAMRKIRFYLRTTTPWLLFGHSLEATSTQVKDVEGFRGKIREFFSVPQEMTAKTELRQ